MSDCHLYKLPNELLLHLFSPIATSELLPLTGISRRLSTVILRILHNRLVAAADLDSHSLLLECYHPSVKLFEPPYFCTYQGTDGLSLYEAESEEDNIGARLGKMQNMYSRFRPHQRELEEGGRRVLRRPGDVPGSRTFSGTAKDEYQGEKVKQALSLESHELFTQLVAQTNLVKIGPRHGLFTSFVDVEEGVLRVWKNWLAEAAAKCRQSQAGAQVEVIEDIGKVKGKEIEKEVDVEVKERELDLRDPQILWVSQSKNSGIRFNVRERKFRRDAPILIRADEGMPVSYEIEYDELLVRTSHLLFALEKSLVQEDNSSGKAVVFGSFGSMQN
ncbi:hypothetical protein BDU57DRAFT_504203 [Ampelomyces quisqualis]|uniref:F-box domain-containing protein n=1 Tax=Ampelomyces quisqualis TaxID=50730 RepID=A0A6A5QEH8_AMPQU|nr:hypothetical protein BDU57DRAFT_504203 [Ampelomyces quisqualis]